MGYFKKMAQQREEAENLDTFMNLERLTPEKIASMNCMFPEHQYALAMEAERFQVAV